MTRLYSKPRPLWRLETIVLISLVVLVLIIAISLFSTRQMLNQALEEDVRNQQLVRTSFFQLNQVLDQQLPLEKNLQRLRASSQQFRDEFELLILDPTRRRDRMGELELQLISLQHTLRPLITTFPPELSKRLGDNLGVLSDIAEEVQDTVDHNSLQQLHRDALDPLRSVQLDIERTLQLQDEETRKLKVVTLRNSLTAKQSLEAHQQVFQQISQVLLLGLLGLLLIILLSQALFFRLLYRRIALLEDYASDIGEGRFRAPPFSSRDTTGRLAVRLAVMGRQIRQLLKKSASEAEKAQQARDEAELLAFYDPLTGLENRRLLFKRLEHAMQSADRHAEDQVALFYLDLDNFKQVNDSMGHDAGDQLLTTVANRLRLCLRHEDCVARLGGDEFAMVVERSDTSCEMLAQRILDRLAQPLKIGEREVQISTSIGIAIAGTDAHTPYDLMKSADLALYRAKELGRNNYQYFSEELNQHAHERMQLIDELRVALREQQFVLYYQPKVSLSSGAVLGLECLIRWFHPEKGFIAPERFISAAEESGLIVPIGEWAIQTACQQARQLEEQGRPLPVAVNVSGRQFHDQALVQAVRRALAETRLTPHLLEVEITETMLLEDIGLSTRLLKQLKKEGVTVAIDDFGTGFSSLNYLKNLPLDVLKLDRSFVQHVCSNKRDAAIARTIIELGHNLDLKVVAEGIENFAQCQHLASEGCDMGQGYLFSHPLPIQELNLERTYPLMA